MEIEINSKKNNPLFSRTEVRFTIHHKGEGTPNREIIRSELAEKLNSKKENIIINNIHSSFGIQKSRGYAKIYSSIQKSENIERKYILKRNKIAGKQQKKKEETKKPEDKPETGDEVPKKEVTIPNENSKNDEVTAIKEKIEQTTEKKE